MSFLVKTPSLPQAGAGADPKFNASIKEARPVPLGWGRHVYAPTWVSDKYDKHTQPAGSNKPDWQYCSIAAKYCHGPIDFVGKVFADGAEIADLDYTFSEHGDPESATFTLNAALASGRSWQVVVHRGTADADTSIVANLRAQTGQQHPPYRGYCWAEWLNIDQGAGNTAVPALALELGMHAPEVGDYPGGDSHPYGVNLFAALYAFATHEAGGAIDSAFIDEEQWGLQSLALEDTGISGRTGNLVHAHPSFDEATSFGDGLSRALAYVDAFLFFSAGKLCIGWFPAQPVDAGDLPEIAEADLAEKPRGALPDWSKGPTSVTVVFKSFAKNYEDEAARYNAPTNRENNYAGAAVRADRPFIHAADQAALIAAEIAASGGNEKSLTLTVLKSRAVDGDGAPLMPGSLFNYDYAPHALDLVCRVIARRIRPGSASDVLTIVRERGAFPRPYVAAIDDRVLPTPVDPGEVGSGDVRLFLLPSGFGDMRQVAAFVNRPSREIIGALLSLSPTGSSPWETILDQRWFPALCEVGGSGVDDADTTIRIGSTSVDFARMAAQSTVAQTDDTLLLLVDDELLSVSAVDVVSAGVYDLAVIRGRQGSEAAAHTATTACWLFYRAELVGARHNEFYNVRVAGVYDTDEATKYFKVALQTVDAIGDPKPDDPGLDLLLPDADSTIVGGFTIILTSEAHTVACDSAGTVLSGQLGSGGTARTTVLVFAGTTALTAVSSGDVSGQYSIAIGTLTNTTATKETDDTVRCDTLTADTGTIEIAVSIEGTIALTKKFTLTKAKGGADGADGADGTRGSKHFYAATTGTSWSDSEANAAIVAAGLTKVLLDEVTLYKTSAGYSESRFWDGSAWIVVTQVIDGNLLVTGTVGASALVTADLVALIASLGGFTFASGVMTSTSASFVTEIGPAFGGTGGYFLIEHTGVGHVVYIGGSVLGGTLSVFDSSGTQVINLDGSSGTVTATTFSGSIASSNVTGLATSATTDTTSASNIGSGTLNTARLPATIDIATAYKIAGTQVVGAQGAVIANAGTANDIDGSYNETQLESLFNAFGSKINEIISALRTHGLIAT